MDSLHMANLRRAGDRLAEFHHTAMSEACRRAGFRIAELEVELTAERERREAAEAALGEVVACNNSDPILISREPGYRWYDVIKQATSHFTRYKD